MSHQIKIEYKNNDTLKNLDHKFIITVQYGNKYIPVITNETKPTRVLALVEHMVNTLLQDII